MKVGAHTVLEGLIIQKSAPEDALVHPGLHASLLWTRGCVLVPPAGRWTFPPFLLVSETWRGGLTAPRHA